MWRIGAIDREGREVASAQLASGELTIGRDADRQLILPSASVSRRHARLVVDSSGVKIIDEGSANGVVVNGVRINAPTPVGPGARIEISEFRIQVESPLPALTSSPQSATIPPVDPGSAPQSLRLVAEGGPYDGRVFEIAMGETSVGRATDNALVLDDPSLSRKHARILRSEESVEVEDLGSSNGTFVNGRKVGRGMVITGGALRFGELHFRVEGTAGSHTRAVEPLERRHLYTLVSGAAVTVTVLLLMLVVLLRKPRPVQASGREGITHIAKLAEQHDKAGRALYAERKYQEAKTELEAALEMDPANVEAARLRILAQHAPEDDQLLSSANASLTVGDRKAIERALGSFAKMTPGTNAQGVLAGNLSLRLERLGFESWAKRAYADCAWAFCRAFEVAPPEARPAADAARTLREAEKKLKRDRDFVPSRAAF
jgi:pSer/pThr/pTyr-binding forkhead associated (FHA) protein